MHQVLGLGQALDGRVHDSSNITCVVLRGLKRQAFNPEREEVRACRRFLKKIRHFIQGRGDVEGVGAITPRGGVDFVLDGLVKMSRKSTTAKSISMKSFGVLIHLVPYFSGGRTMDFCSWSQNSTM